MGCRVVPEPLAQGSLWVGLWWPLGLPHLLATVEAAQTTIPLGGTCSGSLGAGRWVAQTGEFAVA